MKSELIKMPSMRKAAAAAVAASMIMSSLPLAAESGIVPEKKEVFKGEDMCIAILDRGFAFEHESLIITDKEPKLSKQRSDTLFKNTIAYRELSENMGETREKIFKKEKRLSVYVNEKIPFAYDYGDNDTDLSGDFATHGMAMMSVAAGTDTLYGGTAAISAGTAPEAQILAMKVYSDEVGGVTGEAVSAAVNDAVTMGADVIYIAVTELCGFEEKEWPGLEQSINNAWENGVIVVSAAGDTIEYGKGNIFDRLGSIYYITADSPDVGTVAYPSSSPKVISVGSADRYEIISDFLTLGDGEAVPYSDSNYLYEINGVKKSFAQHFEGRELEYVICEGVGKPEELSAAGDLKGKAAVVSRGEITFAEKAKNAAAFGAAALVIYNDTFTLGALNTMIALDDSPIPAIFIEAEDFKKMASSEKRSFVTNIGDSYSTVINKSPFVSVFSPSGTTPELGLKPDVMAVGTAVRCAMPSGGYGAMNSTTAAAAKVAGICAGIKEYILESGEKLTNRSLADRVRSLLVNSASVINDMAAGELYSPRKQGGGLVSLERAVGTELLISSGGNYKAELGDGHSSVIEFEITVQNISDTAKECSIDCTVGTDGYARMSHEDFESAAAENISWENFSDSSDGKISFITHYEALGDVDIYIDGKPCRINTAAEEYQPYSFTLGPRESRTIRVKLVLDEGTYNTYSEIFKNGFFIEGFLRLFDSDAISSVPFLAFCGDFNEAGCIDAELYSGETAVFESCYLYYESPDSSDGIHVIGEISKDGDTDFDRSYMAFSPKVNPHSAICLNLGLKRSIKELTVTVTSEDGEVVSEQKHENIPRTHVSASTGDIDTPNYLIWNGRAEDNWGYIYADGVYTVTVRYRRVASDEEKSFTYDIVIDSTAPKIALSQYESGDGKYMKVTAEDNHKVASVTVFDSHFKTAEISSAGLADITGLTGEYIYGEVIDASGNKNVVRVDNPNYR